VRVGYLVSLWATIRGKRVEMSFDSSCSPLTPSNLSAQPQVI
jgi:hypothetical protein